jgi:hypothetical protein
MRNYKEQNKLLMIYKLEKKAKSFGMGSSKNKVWGNQVKGKITFEQGGNIESNRRKF